MISLGNSMTYIFITSAVINGQLSSMILLENFKRKHLILQSIKGIRSMRKIKKRKISMKI